MTLPGQRWWDRIRALTWWQRPWLGFVAALLAAGLAVGLVRYATARWGPGANSDGLTYLVLARYIYREGVYGLPRIDGTWRLEAHFPPGYPLLIAALYALTGDEARAALLVNLASLVLLVALAVREVYRATRHLWPALATGLTLAVAFPVIRLYAWVLSEGPFLAWVLAVAWALERWQRKPTGARGLLLGLMVAWGVYVRWLGLALVAWVGLWVLGVWRRRGLMATRSAAAFLAAALLPIAALFLASSVVTGAPASRTPGWHPPTAATWWQAVETLSAWVTQPFTDLSPAQTAARAAAVVAAALGLSLGAWLRTGPGGEDTTRLFLLRWWSFIFGYLLTLVGAITLMDASTPMDWRLLAPLFPPLVMVTAASAWTLMATWWPAALLLALVWVQFLRVHKVYDEFFLRQWHRRGAVLRSEAWQTADIWPLLALLPPEVRLYTNERIETYYYVDRPAENLPPFPTWREGRAYICHVVTLRCRPLPYTSMEAWWQDTVARLSQPCQAVALITVGLHDDEARQRLQAWQQRLEDAMTLWGQTASGTVFLRACPPR